MTWPGRLVAMASFMIGIEEVLDSEDGGVVNHHLVEFGEHGELVGFVLDDGLDHHLAVGHVLQVGGVADAGLNFGDLIVRQVPGLSGPLHGHLDSALGGVDHRSVDLPEQHIPTGKGAHLGDSATHEPAADDPDSLDLTHRDDLVRRRWGTRRWIDQTTRLTSLGGREITRFTEDPAMASITLSDSRAAFSAPASSISASTSIRSLTLPFT